MRRVLGTVCAIGAVVLACPRARAQEDTQFARSGQFAVSAERLFGVVHSSTDTDDPNGGTRTQSYTTVNLLMNPYSGLVSVYAFPRIAADYFVIDGLSLGAALGFFTLSGHVKSDTVDQDTSTVTGFLLAPRIGYAFMFNQNIGIWPRVGISYLTTHSENDTGDSSSDGHQLALPIEVPLVISPIPHVGFLIGPTLDLGLTGSEKTKDTFGGMTTTTKQDTNETDFGVQAGLLVYF